MTFQDIIPYLPYVAMLLLGGGWASGNPTVQAKVKELWDKIKSLGTSSKKDSKPNSYMIEVTDDDIGDPLPTYSVHELLEELLTRSQEEGDSEGLMLLGAYGKHVYDLRLNVKPVIIDSKPKKKTPAKVEEK